MLFVLFGDGHLIYEMIPELLLRIPNTNIRTINTIFKIVKLHIMAGFLKYSLLLRTQYAFKSLLVLDLFSDKIDYV